MRGERQPVAREAEQSVMMREMEVRDSFLEVHGDTPSNDAVTETLDHYTAWLNDQEELIPVERAESLVRLAHELGATTQTGVSDEQVAELRDITIPEMLGSDVYAACGRELAALLPDKKTRLTSAVLADIHEDSAPVLSQLSPGLRDMVAQRFCALGQLREKPIIEVMNDGERSETPAYALESNKARKRLATGAIHSAELWSKLYHNPDVSTVVAEAEQILEEAGKTYDAHDEKRRIKDVVIETGKSQLTVLPVNELRIGHQDSKAGLELVQEVANRVVALPADEKPDVILVSNLIQGDFSHSQSKKRPSLAEGLNSNNSQFRVARALLEKLQSTGVPIVMTLGSDDHRIMADYTMDVIREVDAVIKDGVDAGFIPYYDQNKLTQSKWYQEHYKFQRDMALPLCYRMGRRLKTAEEVATLRGVKSDKSEYLYLYEHIKAGEPLPAELEIDEALLVELGEADENGMRIVDDANLVFETSGERRTIEYRHRLGLTAESLPANHSDVARKQLGNLGTMGYMLPDMLMYGRAQEAVHVTASGVPAVSLPGLTDPVQSLQSEQYYAKAPGDASLRANTTRKRLWTPGVDQVTITDDGRVKHTYFNKELMEKADSLPQRMAIFEICDFQIGSPTARPDLQVKYLHYILEKAREMPVSMHVAGDIIHGNIYPNFPFEAQSIGLIRPESQMLMVSDMMNKIFPDAPVELRQAVLDVMVQQGNHDEEQRIRMPGNHSPNIDYLIRDMRTAFDEPGEPSKVRHDATFHTEDGVLVPTWIGRSHYGAYNINTAHYHINKGAKGSNGGLPVYHAHQRAQGLGSAETPDIILGAHWHNEQSALIGNTLVVVGGAMAGRSEFEDMLGYDARIAGTCLELGGGEPPSVEFIHPETLHAQNINFGYFADESLADHGFTDDRDFDPARHGIYSMDDRPKSGLQKSLLHMGRLASQRAEYLGTVENPNRFDAAGNPLVLNDATRRLYEYAGAL